MKTLLSIALAFACLGMGYSIGYRNGQRDQIEATRAEIQLIARDYAKCLDQLDAQRLREPGYTRPLKTK
jgi:hypothetical protein